jgi:EpsI family protein
MGQISRKKLIVLVVCLLITSGVIYRDPSIRREANQEGLSQALSGIPGWKLVRSEHLDREVLQALEVDEYVSARYSNGGADVALYVGYYKTMGKLGSAHSPLVCFPGQGWVLSSKMENVLTIDGRLVSLTKMVTEKGQNRAAVIYWFQANKRTSHGTFWQKIYAFWSKILDSREENAFVRVSVSLHNKSTEEAFYEGIEFVKAFYPCFFKYITGKEI